MRHPNQENCLSFSNITQNMQAKKHQLTQSCSRHPGKPARYRDLQRQRLICTTCAVQEASRGGSIEELDQRREAGSVYRSLSSVYEQTQQEIREQIEEYNNRHQQLVEALADMQIRDLLTFNRSIEANQAIYEQLMADSSLNMTHQSMKQAFERCQANSHLLTKIDSMINSLQKEGTLEVQQLYRSVEDHKYTFSRAKGSEGQSGQRVTSFKGQSLRSVKANSQKSKNSTMEEFRRSSIEDTPESVRSRLSNNCLRLNQEAAVAMFDKIDVCESVDISGADSKEPEERSSFKSLRSRYRYASNEMQQS